MSRTKAVMIALLTLGKAADSAGKSYGFDTVISAGKHFVYIALMSNVKYDVVVRSVKNTMKSHGKFNYAEIRSEMSAVVRNYSDKLVAYLIGKVTLYDSYNVEARNLLLYFLDLYFGDKQRLLKGRHPLESNIDTEKLKPLFVGNNYDEDYKVLRNAIREYGEVIPPMMNAYMNLSNDMRVFETIHNPELGNVYETGIMITIGSIYPDKYDRYTKW